MRGQTKRHIHSVSTFMTFCKRIVTKEELTCVVINLPQNQHLLSKVLIKQIGLTSVRSRSYWPIGNDSSTEHFSLLLSTAYACLASSNPPVFQFESFSRFEVGHRDPLAELASTHDMPSQQQVFGR